MSIPKNHTPVTREQFRDMLADFTQQLTQQVKHSLADATQERKQAQLDAMRQDLTYQDSVMRALRSLFKRSL